MTATVAVRFYAPAPALAHYISSYYDSEIDAGDGLPVRDMLHPEWANIRITLSGEIRAAVGGKPLAGVPGAVITGPTSRATAFETDRATSFGIGLLPLGWAVLIGGDASKFADRLTDLVEAIGEAAADELTRAVRAAGDSAARIAAADALFTARLATISHDDALIARAHAALTDPEVTSVVALAERIGIPVHRLERLSRHAFGFAPKLLLRRQRFVRTLAVLMLDHTQKWTPNLDPAYYDQAHFHRDFQRFMGMAPSAYMALPHPVLDAAAPARQAYAGAPMQTLHKLAEKDS